jgi:hypothetical protein
MRLPVTGASRGPRRPPREVSRFAAERAGLRCTHAIDRATRILGYDPLVRKLLAG